MLEVQVRKRLTVVEEIFHEGGPAASVPLRRAAVLAVIHNPYAGKYVPEIAGFMDDLKSLGLTMAHSLIAALGTFPGATRCGSFWATQRRSSLPPKK